MQLPRHWLLGPPKSQSSKIVRVVGPPGLVTCTPRVQLLPKLVTTLMSNVAGQVADGARSVTPNPGPGGSSSRAPR